MSNSEIASQVSSVVEENPVVVFSKVTCPYSAKTKKVLTQLGYKFKTVELDEIANGAEMEEQLKAQTKLGSTPYVFVNRECIGDNQNVQILNKQNQLATMLQESGAQQHFNAY